MGYVASEVNLERENIMMDIKTANQPVASLKLEAVIL